MSLAIDPDKVAKVLLVDGWHDCRQGSFSIDSYEYVEADYENDGRMKDGHTLLGGGNDSHIASHGFSFYDPQSGRICGPLTSVIAVTIVSKD